MGRSKRLRNVHPGEVLVEEFLRPFGLTQYQLAKRIRVPLTRISEICRGRRRMTADTALRLALRRPCGLPRHGLEHTPAEKPPALSSSSAGAPPPRPSG